MHETAAPEQTESLGVAGSIRLSYWLAILLIAALATASFAIMNRELRNHPTDKELIRLAGEQTMLSQRITALSHAAHGAEHVFAHAATLNELRRSIDEFEANHRRVVEASEAGNELDRQAATRLKTLLTDQPYTVDRLVREFVDDARAFVALSADPAKRLLADPVPLDSATAALSGYHQIVDVMSQNARMTAERTATLSRALFSAMMLVLAAAVLFIFRPMIRNVAERTHELIDARNEMAHLAAHDRLTGLRNRVFLTDHFEHMIEGAKRRGERVAVLHLDLDNFKFINDTYGHMAGDHVLSEIGNRIKSVVRAADIPARIGGDEFVILLNAPGESADIERIATRIIEAVTRPIEFESTVLRCGASIGISVYPDDADNPADLLVDSDLALYQAKEAGRGHARFFSDELRREHEVRRELESDLRKSLQRKEINVHYQPQVSLATARVTGIEALARWNRNGNEYVPPQVFLPVAEKSGLLLAIGRHVISSAIAQAAEWHHAGLEYGRISVNAARAELTKDDFVSFVLDTAREHDLPANKLSVEIAEGMILEDDKRNVADNLRRLRAAGVQVELDDFGSGYASLTHINSTEIDRLKIDERFIRNIDKDRGKRRIVRGLIEMAKGLDIAVVAEGAETISEMETLRSIGCSNVQGYGIAFPMDAALVTEWLHIHSPCSPIPLYDDEMASA
ncbi:putative bifunctional diguanylate cyclase/phosphodiesterase [Oricola thermophila]|uniref:EAL domain-containing protein n=1 Tax=Oricola thermophila TaxID=2742145 RepID=A0A6N1VJ12_9HYPH|nr:EAL domain-containing protein [Oricola thermophila]QKV19199.1 EAL domain-containing protein [Oricola thermophila]